MGRKLNLAHLSEGECRQILDVIQRDYSIRQKEKERLVKLQKLVKDEEQKRLVLSRQKQFNAKYCICCFSSFGLIFNKRAECKSCGFFVCRDCSVKPEGQKEMMCLGCDQQRELQVQVCEWFYGQIRNRFRRFGSAKVVRSLYKKDSLSSDSVDHSSNDSGVDHGHQLSPPAKEGLNEQASNAFLDTLEKQTSTANKELLGVPYKALLDNPDWLPLFKPEMMSVAIQAPEDVLPDVLDSRQALEDFVFNLPPEEEELGKRMAKKPARRHSGPEVVVLDPDGEPLSKPQDSNRKVHFGEMPALAKSKDASLTSGAAGAAYHVLSPIEEVLSSPEIVDKYSDRNGNNPAGSSCSVKDRGSIDRLSLGEDDKRSRADSSSSISPHDWDSGIHMPLCLTQDGGWEVSLSTASGSDPAAKLGSPVQSLKSDSDSFTSVSLLSLDANDTLDSLETQYNSVHSDTNTPEVTDEYVSSSSTLVENQSVNEDNDDGVNSVGIEIEKLTLSRSSSEETLKTDDEDDLDCKVGDLTMEEFLHQLTHVSLSGIREDTKDLSNHAAGIMDEQHVNPSLTDETRLASSNEDSKQDEMGSLNQRMKIAEEIQPLLAEEEEDTELAQHILVSEAQPVKERRQDHVKVEPKIQTESEEKHFKCTKSHHHHSSRSHVHDSSARGKNPYKRSKSNDDFILSGRSGDGKSKSNGSKSHRRDGEPSMKCTKESHHHGRHHERSPSNRFIRYDSLPLVVEVFEAEGSYHWHHHSHRDFRQFSRESDSNDSEPSNQVASKSSRSGAKLVRAAHLSPKSSYEEDPSQSRQLSMESTTTEDTMPKSTSQSSGPTTPESRRDSQQLAGMSSEDSSREEQCSPDKLLHYSPTEHNNGLQSRLNLSQAKPTSLDYKGKERNIQDSIDSLRSSTQGESSLSSTGHIKKDEETTGCHPDRSSFQAKPNSTAPTSESQPSQKAPKQLESPHLSPCAMPSQPSPLASPLQHPSLESLLRLSPSTPPTQLSPGASSLTTPMRMASLKKDIQELANLTKKVSITQEEMLLSAEEVLTSAHKMSNIQTQVEKLEDVLDSLERTVIGESSSLYGSSSSENEDSVVGPQEQVEEDMQLLEKQLANSHTDNTPSENNSASAVRMITTTALKLLGTTEDAMESHSASLASQTPQTDASSQSKNSDGGEVGKEICTKEVGLEDSHNLSRGSSEEEEMCACSSTDGSRPSSLTLDDGLTRNPCQSQNPSQQLDGGLESQTVPLKPEKSRNPTLHGVAFLHLHPGQDSPPIATLMCEMEEDVRNGNGISAAGSPFKNGDSSMLDEAACKPTSPRLSVDSCIDLTFEIEGGFDKDKAAERRRRKERKLRKSSGYTASPTREQEIDSLLYNQMADLEEKVYLSAGKVFTLEERLQRLHEQVIEVDRTSPEENIVELEDKIALTMAQVAQSENQVRAVEAQIEALQRSRESTMDISQFNTVSVAMCDLASPERYDPYAYSYGSSVQIQIPRERVDSPGEFVVEVSRPNPEYNNNEDGMEVEREVVALEMGITRDEGVAVNDGQTEPFAVERCAVSLELRPISAVIVRYLQEGDDDSLWPDFRFHRNKPGLKHAREKRPKLDADVPNSYHSEELKSEGTERHISTLELSLDYPDKPITTPNGQPEVSVSIPVNEIEELLHA